MKLVLVCLLGLFAFSGGVQSFAHTTVEIEQYEVEVGWGIEPPIVGYRNDFVFQISEPGEQSGLKAGILNAFKDITATAKFGGITKTLDIGSDPRPGHYFAHVIPTKTGSYSIELKGKINEVTIDVEIPVEDVEGTSILDFPPGGNSGDQNISGLKNSLSQLQREVSLIKSGTGIATSSDGGQAYDFAVLGLSIGAAAIILAIIALIKRK